MKNQVQESIAMMMIGDGVLAMARPQQHCALWLRGPVFWQRSIKWFVQHPEVTRALGVAEAAVGLWWSFQLRPSRTDMMAATQPDRRC